MWYINTYYITSKKKKNFNLIDYKLSNKSDNHIKNGQIYY